MAGEHSLGERVGKVMAVLIEAISVVVRVSSIARLYEGGARAFAADVPNNSLCADGELVRVGFMSPADAQAYVEQLERCNLKYLERQAHFRRSRGTAEIL